MEASLVELEPLRMVLEEKEEEEEVNVRGRKGQWRSIEWVLVDVVLVSELTGKDDAIAAVISKPSTQDIIPSSSTLRREREPQNACGRGGGNISQTILSILLSLLGQDFFYIPKYPLHLDTIKRQSSKIIFLTFKQPTTK